MNIAERVSMKGLWLALGVVFLVMAVFSNCCAGVNLVPNGGFEDGLWGGVAPTSQMMLDSNSASEGQYSLKLISGDNAVSLSTQFAALDSAKKYRISATIRALYLQSNACYIKLLTETSGGQTITSYLWYLEVGDPGFPDPGLYKERILITGGTRDWYTFYTTISQTPADACSCTLEVGLMSNSESGVRYDEQQDEYGWLGDIPEASGDDGIAWIDDIRIEEIGEWPLESPYFALIRINGEIGAVEYFHGCDADIDLVLNSYNSETMEVSYSILDGWGEVVAGGVVTPVWQMDGTWTYNIQHGGTGYYGITFYITDTVSGTQYIVDNKSYGILPAEDADYYEADANSPFGLWVMLWPHEVGDMAFRDIGAKWTQGSLHWDHWDYVDGQWEQYSPNFAQNDVARFEPQNVKFGASGGPGDRS